MVRTTAYRSAELWTQGEKLVRALAFCIFIGVRVLDCILSFIKNFTSPIFSSRAHLAQKGHCSNAKAQRGCPLTPLSSLEKEGAEE